MGLRSVEPGTVNMICGPRGAGKTTYATALAQKQNALSLTMEEWMGRMFWPDAVPGDEDSWEAVRIDRCLSQMRAVLLQTVPLGISAVVDADFMTRVERSEFGGWGEEQGWQVVLRWIDAERETRWLRILSRESQPGGSLRTVSRPQFERAEERWHPPEPDEMARWWGRRVVIDD
ncbi:MAG: AAA family ATPase [Pseudomonadota bacterium]